MDERAANGDLNSPEYWNRRFVVDWTAEGGPLQTVFFAELCVRELPQWLVDEVCDRRLSIFDYGCAFGDALPVWRRLFPQSSIAGGDVAQAALGTARRLYPDFAFTNLSGAELNGGDDGGPLADLVYCSNTLEHFADWRAVLDRLARRAGHFVVVMVPFEEEAPVEEHAASFEYDTLPPCLPSGHRLLHLVVVDAAAEPDSQWNGLQLVAVYGRERPAGRRDGLPAREAAAGTASPRTMVFDLRDIGAAALGPLFANLAAMSRERRRIAAAAEAAETEAFHLKTSEAEAVDRALVLRLTLTGVLREYADLVRGLEKAQQWVIGRLAEFDPQLEADHDLPPIAAEWPAAGDDFDAGHR
ncbi:MAG: class I SAM-dependent methyltransferase, partial [Thiohalocapsa sp.]